MSPPNITISIRIDKRPTSISLRKNIVALWIIMNGIPQKRWKEHITDFIYSCVSSWNGDSAKGFSEYISNKLIQGILDPDDISEFKEVMEVLQCKEIQGN